MIYLRQLKQTLLQSLWTTSLIIIAVLEAVLSYKRKLLNINAPIAILLIVITLASVSLKIITIRLFKCSTFIRNSVINK
jgi:hypothetical protein